MSGDSTPQADIIEDNTPRVLLETSTSSQSLYSLSRLWSSKIAKHIDEKKSSLIRTTEKIAATMNNKHSHNGEEKDELRNDRGDSNNHNNNNHGDHYHRNYRSNGVENVDGSSNSNNNSSNNDDTAANGALGHYDTHESDVWDGARWTIAETLSKDTIHMLVDTRAYLHNFDESYPLVVVAAKDSVAANEIFSKDYRRGTITVNGKAFHAPGHVADNDVIGAALGAFQQAGISKEASLQIIRNYQQPLLYTIRYLIDHFVSRHVGHNQLFTRIARNILDIRKQEEEGQSGGFVVEARLAASGITLFDPTTEVELSVPGSVMVCFSLNPEFDPGSRSIEGKYGAWRLLKELYFETEETMRLIIGSPMLLRIGSLPIECVPIPRKALNALVESRYFFPSEAGDDYLPLVSFAEASSAMAKTAFREGVKNGVILIDGTEFRSKTRDHDHDNEVGEFVRNAFRDGNFTFEEAQMAIRGFSVEMLSAPEVIVSQCRALALALAQSVGMAEDFVTVSVVSNPSLDIRKVEGGVGAKLSAQLEVATVQSSSSSIPSSSTTTTSSHNPAAEKSKVIGDIILSFALNMDGPSIPDVITETEENSGVWQLSHEVGFSTKEGLAAVMGPRVEPSEGDQFDVVQSEQLPKDLIQWLGDSSSFVQGFDCDKTHPIVVVAAPHEAEADDGFAGDIRQGCIIVHGKTLSTFKAAGSTAVASAAIAILKSAGASKIDAEQAIRNYRPCMLTLGEEIAQYLLRRQGLSMKVHIKQKLFDIRVKNGNVVGTMMAHGLSLISADSDVELALDSSMSVPFTLNTAFIAGETLAGRYGAWRMVNKIHFSEENLWRILIGSETLPLIPAELHPYALSQDTLDMLMESKQFIQNFEWDDNFPLVVVSPDTDDMARSMFRKYLSEGSVTIENLEFQPVKAEGDDDDDDNNRPEQFINSILSSDEDEDEDEASTVGSSVVAPVKDDAAIFVKHAFQTNGFSVEEATDAIRGFHPSMLSAASLLVSHHAQLRMGNNTMSMGSTVFETCALDIRREGCGVVGCLTASNGSFRTNDVITELPSGDVMLWYCLQPALTNKNKKRSGVWRLFHKVGFSSLHLKEFLVGKD